MADQKLLGIGSEGALNPYQAGQLEEQLKAEGAQYTRRSGQNGTYITVKSGPELAQEKLNNAVGEATGSLEASIPEVEAKYTSRISQVSAEKDPLIARYEKLLAGIRGNETTQANTVTRSVNREMGRRGVPLSSTFVDQEVQGQTQPIHAAAQSNITDATIAREGDLRSIENDITNLTQESIAAKRDIRNTVANLKVSASQSEVDRAIQMYQIQQQERDAALGRALQERQIAIQEQEAKKTPTASLVSIGKDSYLYDPVAKTFISPPKSSTSSGSGTGKSLADLMAQVGL